MDGSRTRKSIVNLTVNITNQLLSVLISFVTRTVFIRVFAARYLGLNAVFSDVLSLLSLADLGIGTAMSYSFYKPLAEGDKRQLAALTRFYRKIYRCIAAAAAAVGLLLIPFLPWLVEVNIGHAQLTVYYLFSLAELVASYLLYSYTAILSADQKNYILTGIRMAVSLLRMAVQLVVMLCLQSYTLYLAVSVFGSLLSNVLASAFAVKKYPFIREQVELGQQEKRGIYQNVGAVFLNKMSALLVNATDNILISVIVSTVTVGLYSNYLLIQNQLYRLFSLVFTSLTASIGNLVVREGARRRYEIFLCEQVVSFSICTFVTPCYVALVNDFITIWLGKGYLLPNPVVYAIGVNLYLTSILLPLWSYREATGLYNRTKWVMTVCAGVNIVLSVLFGIYFGTAGILFASAAARLSTYMWYEPKLLFREYFGKSAGSYFRQVVLNAALTCGLTVAVCWVGDAFPAGSWGGWFIKAVLTGSVCLAVSAAVYGRSEGLAPIWEKLKHYKR